MYLCIACTGDPIKILFSNQYYIRMVDFENQEAIVAQNLSNAVALDYDFANSCLYYSDVTAFGSSIKRICNIFSNKSGTPEVSIYNMFSERIAYKSLVYF